MAITNKMNKPSDRKGLLKLVKILQEENEKLKADNEKLKKLFSLHGVSKSFYCFDYETADVKCNKQCEECRNKNK
jgi:hypothetical protein